MTQTRWPAIYATAAGLLLAILAFLLWATPRTEDGIAWTDPMIPGGWMAWTFPTALFFWCIGSLLVLFIILAIRFPETPRRGILRIETTRGDRLFISLLGSAFIHLGVVGLAPDQVWAAPIISLVYAAAVFRWV
jgi:predicted small integral membrane protein